jgi:hypothetical protein
MAEDVPETDFGNMAQPASEDDMKVYRAIADNYRKDLAAAQPAPVQPVAWVGLERSDMPDGEDPMFDHPFFIKGMVYVANVLMKKNAAPEKGQP